MASSHIRDQWLAHSVALLLAVALLSMRLAPVGDLDGATVFLKHSGTHVLRAAIGCNRDRCDAELFKTGGVSDVVWRGDVRALRSLAVVGTVGDDTLVVDCVNGCPVPEGGLSWDGDAEATAEGDALEVTGYRARSVRSSLVDESSGVVELSLVAGDGVPVRISYTHLEPITLSGFTNVLTIDVGTLTPTGGVVMELSMFTAGTIGVLDSASFEAQRFALPTETIEILGRAGEEDLLTIGSEWGAVEYMGALEVHFGVEDHVTVAPAVTLHGDTFIHTGSFAMEVSDVTLTGTASLEVYAGGSGVVSERSTVTASGGHVVLDAACTGFATTDFTCVHLDRTTIVAPEITIAANASAVSGTGVTVAGAYLYGATLSSSGAVEVVGTGGTINSGVGHTIGVYLQEDFNQEPSVVSGTGVTIEGYRGSTAMDPTNHGVKIANSRVTGAGDYLTITGADHASSGAGHGVLLSDAVVEAIGGCELNMIGHASPSSFPSHGVVVSGTSNVTTADGELYIFGYAGDTGMVVSDRSGVVIAEGPRVETTGTGALTLRGVLEAEANAGHGVYVDDATLRTNTGQVTIDGRATLPNTPASPYGVLLMFSSVTTVSGDMYVRGVLQAAEGGPGCGLLVDRVSMYPDALQLLLGRKRSAHVADAAAVLLEHHIHLEGVGALGGEAALTVRQGALGAMHLNMNGTSAGNGGGLAMLESAEMSCAGVCNLWGDAAAGREIGALFDGVGIALDGAAAFQVSGHGGTSSGFYESTTGVVMESARVEGTTEWLSIEGDGGGGVDECGGVYVDASSWAVTGPVEIVGRAGVCTGVDSHGVLLTLAGSHGGGHLDVAGEAAGERGATGVYILNTLLTLDGEGALLVDGEGGSALYAGAGEAGGVLWADSEVSSSSAAAFVSMDGRSAQHFGVSFGGVEANDISLTIGDVYVKGVLVRAVNHAGYVYAVEATSPGLAVVCEHLWVNGTVDALDNAVAVKLQGGVFEADRVDVYGRAFSPAEAYGVVIDDAPISFGGSGGHVYGSAPDRASGAGVLVQEPDNDDPLLSFGDALVEFESEPGAAPWGVLYRPPLAMSGAGALKFSTSARVIAPQFGAGTYDVWFLEQAELGAASDGGTAIETSGVVTFVDTVFLDGAVIENAEVVRVSGAIDTVAGAVDFFAPVSAFGDLTLFSNGGAHTWGPLYAEGAAHNVVAFGRLNTPKIGTLDDPFGWLDTSELWGAGDESLPGSLEVRAEQFGVDELHGTAVDIAVSNRASFGAISVDALLLTGLEEAADVVLYTDAAYPRAVSGSLELIAIAIRVVDAQVLDASTVLVGDGARLSGNGTVAGDVAVQSGGVLSPTDCLTVSGDLTVAAGGALHVLVVGAGTDCGGTSRVTVDGGGSAALAEGSELVLLDGAVLGVGDSYTAVEVVAELGTFVDGRVSTYQYEGATRVDWLVQDGGAGVAANDLVVGVSVQYALTVAAFSVEERALLAPAVEHTVQVAENGVPIAPGALPAHLQVQWLFDSLAGETATGDTVTVPVNGLSGPQSGTSYAGLYDTVLGELVATEAFTLVITNVAPVVSLAPQFTTAVGNAVLLRVTAVDPVDALSYEWWLYTGGSAGPTLVAQTRTFQYTPEVSGTFLMQVRVSDGTDVVSANTIVEVTNAITVNVPETICVEGEVCRVNATVTSDLITGTPAGFVLQWLSPQLSNPLEGYNVEFVTPLVMGSAGSVDITMVLRNATDNAVVATDTAVIFIANAPPAVAPFGPYRARAGDAFRLCDVSVYDVDQLQFYWSVDGGGGELSDVTAARPIFTAGDFGGTWALTVVVSDGVFSTSASSYVVVEAEEPADSSGGGDDGNAGDGGNAGSGAAAQENVAFVPCPLLNGGSTGGGGGDGGGSGGGGPRPGDGGSLGGGGGGTGDDNGTLSPIDDITKMQMMMGDERDGPIGEQMGEFDRPPMIGDMAVLNPDGTMVDGTAGRCENNVACRVGDEFHCVASMRECEARRCQLSSDTCMDAGTMVEVAIFLPQQDEMNMGGDGGGGGGGGGSVIVPVETVARVSVNVQIPRAEASGKVLTVTSVMPERDEQGFGVLLGTTANVAPIVSDVLEIALVDTMTGERTTTFSEPVVLEFVVNASFDIDDLGMYFLTEDGEWELVDEELTFVRDLGNGQVVVSGRTSHFSSFAVLFSGSDGGHSDPFSGQQLVVWILSASLFVVVVLLSLAFVVVAPRFSGFRRHFMAPSTGHVATLRAMRSQRLSAVPHDEDGTEAHITV